ncbi:hypothetical protein [Nocardioides sambongensis]|nr:hypothetical protein [Nocardioides sambongensis]
MSEDYAPPYRWTGTIHTVTFHQRPEPLDAATADARMAEQLAALLRTE